ncbi:MAG: hypothetical protein U0470_03445 [Anaerolineae bacterium]
MLFYAAVAMPRNASSLRTSIGLVGAVLIAAAVFTVPSELSRAARYDEAERAYLARRGARLAVTRVGAAGAPSSV